MLELNDPQCDFLDLPHKYKALVTGFGGGKTFVGCVGLCRHLLKWPSVDAGYFAPTYPLIRDIFYPTIEEVAPLMSLSVDVKVSSHEVRVYRGRKYRGKIICRTMDNPAKIIGFKIGHALVDELDTLPLEKAAAAWRKIIARLRYKRAGLRNGIDVTTTPEGFRFVYEQWVKAVRDKPALADLYGMVQASTYDNEANLPDDFISSLRESYPPQLIDAYLDGRFVNLASGSVYPDFDRKLNHADAVMNDAEPLHIGMDFNVLNMSAVITVVRDSLPVVVGELMGVRDTREMARMLKERFKAKGHAVVVYPDASGGSTSSKNASESDLSILREAGLSIRVNPSNPAVKDRVNAMNGMILNDRGERRLKVNTHLAPITTEALEKQAYDQNGEPDKKSGFDHPNDALGYRIVKDWPLTGRPAYSIKMGFATNG